MPEIGRRKAKARCNVLDLRWLLEAVSRNTQGLLIRDAFNHSIQHVFMLGPSGNFLIQNLKKLGPMVVVHEMGQFVDDHVVDAGAWCFDQVRVQDDLTGGRAGAPLPGHIQKSEGRRGGHPRQLRRQVCQPMGKVVPRLGPIPCPHAPPDLVRMSRPDVRCEIRLRRDNQGEVSSRLSRYS